MGFAADHKLLNDANVSDVGCMMFGSSEDVQSTVNC